MTDDNTISSHDKSQPPAGKSAGNSTDQSIGKHEASSDSAESKYADTAYRAQIWKTQPLNTPHKMSGMTSLPFDDYRQVVPDFFHRNMHEIIHAVPSTKEEQQRIPFRFDTKQIRSATSTRQFVDVFFTFGGYMLLITSAGSLLTCLFLFFYTLNDNRPDLTGGLIEMGIVSVIAMGISVLMILLTKLPYSIGKHLFGEIVPELELNRQTGMVTKWRYVPILGTKRKPIVKPFSEFVPYLHQMVTPTGTGAGWRVILMHKDSRKLSFGSYGLANLTSRGDALAFWDFLQRYMDVEQPVPDIPMLESSRQSDPTTRDHDQKMARPERFWRDMTAEQMNNKAHEMYLYVSKLASGNDLPSYQYNYREFEFFNVRRSKRNK